MTKRVSGRESVALSLMYPERRVERKNLPWVGDRVQAPANRVDSSLGCVLGSALGDAFGDVDSAARGRFGHSTELSILEGKAFIDAATIEGARASIFALFGDWVEEADDPPKFLYQVLRDRYGFEGAAERVLGMFPNSGRGVESVTVSALSASRWKLCVEGGSAFVARRFCSAIYADPAAIEARALLHRIISTQKLGSEQGFESHNIKTMMRKTIPEYQRTYRSVLEGDHVRLESVSGPWRCIAQALELVRSSGDFQDCIESVARTVTGEESRAVGVVAGMIAGTKFGASGLPAEWLSQLHGSVLGERFDANGLIDLHTALLDVPNEPES